MADDCSHYDLVRGPMVPSHPPIVRMKNDGRGPAKQQHRQEDQRGTGADGRDGYVQLVTDDLSTSQDPRGGGSDTAPEKLPPQAQGAVRICLLVCPTIREAGGR